MSEIPKAVESKKSVEKNNLPWEKEIIKDTQERTYALKRWETEFEKLEKNEKYSEELRELMSSLSWYIDTKLWNWFNKIQKDNIKLVFLDKVSQDINSGWLNNISSKIQKTLNNIASIFSKEKNKWKEDNNVKNKLENFKNEFSNLWLDWYINDLDKKIENLKEEKNKKQFNKLATAFSALWIEEKDLNDIKEDLSKTSKTFEQFWKSASIIQKGADKLWMWDMLKDFISSLKDIPIIWPFLMMFFKWFEKNNWTNKKQKSISNLQTFLENKEKSHLDKIEENNNFKNKEKLNPEKLESFYEYLDTKNIDYSKETFWENFLNWENSKWDDIPDNIIKLKWLFDSTFKNWDSMQDISLKDFIKKLNNLWKIEKNKKVNEKDERIKKLEWELNENTKKDNKNMTSKVENNNSIKEITSTAVVWKNISGKQSFQKIEKNNITEEEKQRKLQELYNLKFEKSLLTVWETHKIYFKFNWEKPREINIELNWNIMTLDWKEYRIKLLATEHDNMQILKNISFSWNNVVLEYQSWLFTSEKKVLSPIKFWEILKQFWENNWNYSQKIPWKPATLIITKA